VSTLQKPATRYLDHIVRGVLLVRVGDADSRRHGLLGLVRRERRGLPGDHNLWSNILCAVNIIVW
jgi:hypothetical protein